jgi:hypothetical protein
VSVAFAPKAADSYISFKQIKKTINKELNISEFNLKEIKLNDTLSIKGKFFRIIQSSPLKSSFIVYNGRVNTCRTGGCNKTNVLNASESSEYFDYIILFNKKGEIQHINIYNYRATHGYEISANWWLKQFEGSNSDSRIEVNKNIDSISGATISVYAITDDIKEKLQILSEYLEKD